MRLRPYDYLSFLIAVAVIVSFSVHAWRQSGPATTVEIRGEGALLVYPLDEERVVHVPGPLGETIVEIGGGRARVVFSPCRDQICVLAGWIERGGQWAACLPNRVFVTIQSALDDGPDAFTY